MPAPRQLVAPTLLSAGSDDPDEYVHAQFLRAEHALNAAEEAANRAMDAYDEAKARLDKWSRIRDALVAAALQS